MAASRTKIVAGNWKMNLDRAGAKALTAAVAARTAEAAGVELVLCPPSVYADVVKTTLVAGGSPAHLTLGAQNMLDKPSGAFTGEVSAAMLKDVGCQYVILGHSERRTLCGETDSIVNAKTKAALATGLTPIVCVGELLEEREAGRTQAVVTTQIQRSLAGLTPAELERVVVAYEPVWAIGTGVTATPDQAQDVHAMIRGLVSRSYGPEASEKLRIQYGGSVKPDNAAELLGQTDIDGALVGGASLKVDAFAGIVNAVS